MHSHIQFDVPLQRISNIRPKNQQITRIFIDLHLFNKSSGLQDANQGLIP